MDKVCSIQSYIYRKCVWDGIIVMTMMMYEHEV